MTRPDERLAASGASAGAGQTRRTNKSSDQMSSTDVRSFVSSESQTGFSLSDRHYTTRGPATAMIGQASGPDR